MCSILLIGYLFCTNGTNALREPVERYTFRGLYEGQVVEITGNTLIMVTMYAELNGGPIIKFSNNDQPLRFRLSNELAAGNPPTNVPGVRRPIDSRFRYLASDVKISDILEVVAFEKKSELYCYEICIRRRPGGFVPMAPGENYNMRAPFHTRMNVYQAFEELGTPIPDKWGGKRREEELTARLKHVNSILATVEKIEKEKKAKELKDDPKAEKK
jgi:hypothetical protein